MVTSYYISKLSRKFYESDFVDYYSRLLQNDKQCAASRNLCRVCLQKGTIPMFEKYAIDLIELVKLYGDINVNREDNNPKYVCNRCFNFLHTASLFKKVAKRSQDYYALKKTAEESDIYSEYETNEVSSDKEIDNFILTNEKKVKKGSSKVTCKICKKTVNKTYYKDHLTMHDPDHKKFVCDVCGMSFRLRCALHNHSLRHQSSFAFKCQLCPYKGNYKELLKTHMKTHSGDYRYMCSECPARFLFKSNLNSHMRKHKEPVYKCSHCKRAFHTKLKLDRHVESDHLGIKNHVCNICGKAFGHRSAMMKHQLHVHKRQKMLPGRMPAYLKSNLHVT